MKEKFKKVIFTVLAYVVFWCVFYGSWFLLPKKYFESHNINMNEWVFLSIVVIVIPILSFFFRKLVKKIFNLHISLGVHILLLVLSMALFIFLLIGAAVSNFTMIG